MAMSTLRIRRQQAEKRRRHVEEIKAAQDYVRGVVDALRAEKRESNSIAFWALALPIGVLLAAAVAAGIFGGR